MAAEGLVPTDATVTATRRANRPYLVNPSIPRLPVLCKSITVHPDQAPVDSAPHKRPFLLFVLDTRSWSHLTHVALDNLGVHTSHHIASRIFGRVTAVSSSPTPLTMSDAGSNAPVRLPVLGWCFVLGILLYGLTRWCRSDSLKELKAPPGARVLGGHIHALLQ